MFTSLKAKETPVSLLTTSNALKIASATSIEPTVPILSPITSEVEHPIKQMSPFFKKTFLLIRLVTLSNLS